MKVRARVVVGMLVATVLVVSAESAGAVAAGPPSDEKVPPKQWARSVCTSVDDWRTTIEDGADSIRDQLDEAANLSEARDILVAFLGDAVGATDTLLDEVRQAGVPKIKDGNKIARLFDDAFTEVRTLFADGQESARTIDVSDPAAFGAAASDLGNTLTEGGDKLERTFDRAGRKYKAANKTLDDPACRNLG